MCDKLLFYRRPKCHTASEKEKEESLGAMQGNFRNGEIILEGACVVVAISYYQLSPGTAYLYFRVINLIKREKSLLYKSTNLMIL